VKLHNAIVRPPSANFADGLSAARLGPPDFQRALHQHDAYCRALESCGMRVTPLAADPRYPDATFVEDTAVLTGRGAILTRPGAPTRAGEVDAIRGVLQSVCPIVDAIKAPGTVDGGDVCEVGDDYFVGISDRSDERGTSQLATVLRSLGYRPSLVDIRGLPGLLHLKSGLAWVGGNRLAAVAALAGLPQFRDFEIVGVAPSEVYAANCILCNDRLLIASGFPLFEAAVARFGQEVVPLAMSEFRKMDGGLSCLSLRY
jgi:dimethylargininase